MRILSFYGNLSICIHLKRTKTFSLDVDLSEQQQLAFFPKTTYFRRQNQHKLEKKEVQNIKIAHIPLKRPQAFFISEIPLNQSYNLKKMEKIEKQDLPPLKLRLRRSKSIRDDFNDEDLVDDPKQEGSFLFSFLCDFINLYSYAEAAEKVAIALGVIVGIGSGASHPLFVYLWLQEIGLGIENRYNLQEKMPTFRIYLYYYIALGFGTLIVNGILFVIWKYVSQSISKRIRIRYLQEFAKQTLAYVERRNGYEWTSEFRTHTLNIEKSIGDKVALFLNLIGITGFGIIGSLVLRWTFTLWLLLVAPIGAIVVMYFIFVQIEKRDVQAQANKEAQDKALEATAMVKTVKMLGSEIKEAASYEEKLQGGQSKLGQFSKRIGLATSLFYFVINCLAGVGFIMGIQCMYGTGFCPTSATGSRYKLDEFLTVLFTVFFCAFNFLQLASNYSAIKSAIQSSKRIYTFINRPKVVKQEEIIKPERIQQISFENVTFAYPMARDRIILRNLNLDFLVHKFNAIAGVTGSGKSTIVQLLLKQYEPLSGVIRVGDARLDQINTSHWLQKVGIVSQEPTLFLGTIRENVLVGKAGATDEEVREALKNANILEFVDSQAEGLDFQIGAGGSKLSGGQKQRIAIARALVKRPELLILDEATSALDPSAEKQIQESLDKIRRVYEQHMTIICIAHRLRTIKNADKVFLIQNGSIAQSGKFDDLDYFRQIREEEEADLKIDERAMFNMIATIFDTVNKPSEMLSAGNALGKTLAKTKTNHLDSSANFLDTEALPAQKTKQSEKSIYRELYSYTKRSTWYVICLILAAIGGFNHNVSAILMSYSTDQMASLYLFGTEANWCQNNSIVPQQVIQQCHDTLDGYFYQSEKYLYGLIGLSVFVLVVYYVKVSMLSKIQAEISFNIRKKLYKKLLSLQVKYFEQQKNQSGQAASDFSNDSRDCSNLLTSYIPILVENFCCAIMAVVVCFAFDWRFGLLTIFIPPLIALSFYIAMLFIGGYEDSSLQQRHQADQIANQFITSFKTILVLDYQNRMLEKYRKAIAEPFLSTILTGGKIGLLYGSGHLILDIVVGLTLYFSIIISKDNQTIPSLSIVIFMISAVYCGFIIGNNFYFISHTSASKAAGARIMNLINAKTQEQAQLKHRTTSEALHISRSEAKGRIEFKNVTFKYKNDDSKPVLNNISFTIEAGHKVAFVGPSGCGKSTLLQLLLRFYDFQGEILFDGKNIFDYDLQEYRQQFTMINQEPSLFAGTINDNIIYNINEISEECIQEVCEKSCAYSLSKQEELQERIKNFRARKVGPKGSNISGGEKQRVACARALARGGSVFLMDEGTSALDRRTEMKLQTGVNQVFQGKTVINVAHRMETISKSDVIFVFDAGQLKEMGNYSQLMNKKAYFYNFVNGNKAHE